MRDRWIAPVLMLIGGVVLIALPLAIQTNTCSPSCLTGRTGAGIMPIGLDPYLQALASMVGVGLIAYTVFHISKTQDTPVGVESEDVLLHPVSDRVEPVSGVVLEVLPDDERVVLEPVVRDPGVTQVEIVNRSQFSKSKVSQVLIDLEKRGLVYREKQGRTFRVYPGRKIEENGNF